MGWKVNNTLLKKLKDSNEKALKKLDEKISETEEMEYESEVRDALLAKAEYLCKIGNRVSNAIRMNLLKLDCNMPMDRGSTNDF